MLPKYEQLVYSERIFIPVFYHLENQPHISISTIHENSTYFDENVIFARIPSQSAYTGAKTVVDRHSDKP